jgi:hypothetical protein
MTWPDAGSTPFGGEKATSWEGGQIQEFLQKQRRAKARDT